MGIGPNRNFDGSAAAPWTSLGQSGESAHQVQFYETDAFLLETISRLIGDSLADGDSGLIIATSAHRLGIEEHLRARGFDLRDLSEKGRYVPLDAADTLARFMVNGWPDASRFGTILRSIVENAAEKSANRRVRAFGEMVALLWAAGKRDAALRLEELWNDLGKTLPFSLCCGYPLKTFSGDDNADLLLKVCAEHSLVIPAESYSSLQTPDERLRSITYLQHKALLLDAETTIRKKTERSLHLREKELTDFLENAAEGLQQVGPEARVLWANPAQLRLLGYSADEYVGHHLAEFYAELECFEEFWRRIIAREVVYDYPAVLRCKNGTLRHVLIHSSGFWEDDQLLYTRCFIRDITERVGLENELKQTVAELEEAHHRKDEFLAMLGHELRNPLSAVLNAIISANLDPARRDHALEIARRQTGQLARLVDDLLDIARITQGRITLRKEPVYVASIVDRALEEARALIESRQQRLAVSISSETQTVQAEADPARLQQVISNLIHNATKFTPPGGRIEVTLERRGTEAVFRVRDWGIGIAPEAMPRIFDLFTQAEVSLDRSQGGLGIGLTLVKRLTEMHGGRVRARSEGIGQGSEFEVSLPISTNAKKGSSPQPIRHSETGAGARVLVVEDNADAAESLMMLLEFLGHEVQVASDGFAALEAIKTSQFDVGLVDIGLPGMDGYEVVRRIRSLPGASVKMLVALTGYGQEEDKQRALAAGFDHHLVKPIDVDRLEAVLAKATANGP